VCREAVVRVAHERARALEAGSPRAFNLTGEAGGPDDSEAGEAELRAVTLQVCT
jgi:hypothetical protein